LNIATALEQGVEALQRESISVPRLTAEVLLAHALGCDRVHLYAHPERELTGVEQLHYGRYLYERLARKPTQYITGRQEFYGREFRVTPAVLIPRPETEILVESALRLASGAARVLDAGTGSGCLAVTLKKEWPAARVFASDLSPAALEVASENARRLDARVPFFCADLLDPCLPRWFDLIVCNPPYILPSDAAGLPAEVREYEPPVALFGDVYLRLLRDATRVLRPGGWLMVEIAFNARSRIEGLAGPVWEPGIVESDLAGIPRVVAWRLR